MNMKGVQFDSKICRYCGQINKGINNRCDECLELLDQESKECSWKISQASSKIASASVTGEVDGTLHVPTTSSKTENAAVSGPSTSSNVTMSTDDQNDSNVPLDRKKIINKKFVRCKEGGDLMAGKTYTVLGTDGIEKKMIFDGNNFVEPPGSENSSPSQMPNMAQNAQDTKEWHKQLTQTERTLLIDKFYHNIISIHTSTARFKSNAETFAKKLENDMYKSANSKEEYFKLLKENLDKAKSAIKCSMKPQQNAKMHSATNDIEIMDSEYKEEQENKVNDYDNTGAKGKNTDLKSQTSENLEKSKKRKIVDSTNDEVTTKKKKTIDLATIEERDKNICKIIDLGYPLEEASQALNLKNGNLTLAADYLISKQQEATNMDDPQKDQAGKSTPVTDKSTSVTGESAPVTVKSTSVTGKSTSATDKATPVTSKSTSATGKSTPVTDIRTDRSSSKLPTFLPPTEASAMALPSLVMDITDVSVQDENKAYDSYYNKMEKEMTCPVCLDLYIDPIILPCSHSLCKQCVNDIKMSRVRNGEEGIKCPSCRKRYTKQIAKLPQNLALKNTVLQFQDISHHQQLVLQKSMEEKPKLTLCKDHHDEHVTMFCDQCKVLICHLCLCDGQGQHIGHKVVTKDAAADRIKENAESEKKSLEPLLDDVQERSQKIEQLCNDIEDVYTKACVQVGKQYDEMLKHLQEKKEGFLQTLTSEKTKAVSNLQKHLGQNRTTLNQVEISMTTYQNVLEESNVEELLSKANEMALATDKMMLIKNNLDKSKAKFLELVERRSIQNNLNEAVDKFRTASGHCVLPLANMLPESNSPGTVAPPIVHPRYTVEANSRTPPSDKELKKVVKKILKRKTTEMTMKEVLKQVYDQYPGKDLTDRKRLIEATVRKFITD